jgi:subtilisin family serine protease
VSWAWSSPKAGPQIEADPWLEWQRERPPVMPDGAVLCRASATVTPDAMREQGWQVSKVYGASSAFFTARRKGADVHAPVEVRLAPSAELELGRRPVIGVIDSDIAVLHDEFRLPEGSGTRIRAFWDQGSDAAPDSEWKVPAELGYGRELDCSAIDRLLNSKRKQREIYAGLDLPLPIGNWSHGTQILGLAAGRSSPTRMATDAAAAACPIVAVRVPAPAFEQTLGLWLNTYLLDGLHYILARARADEAVIVNVSLGGHTGPHDGSSMLEQAIDDLIEREAGRLTVVAAAGNSKRARARARVVLAPDTQQTLSIAMTSDDPTPNFIEGWFDDPSNQALFRFLPPNAIAPPSRWVGAGERADLRDDEGRLVAQLSVIEAGKAANGVRGQVMMAVAQTRGAVEPPAAPARAGIWTLAVRSPATLTLDAWVARDDSLRYDLRPKGFTEGMAGVSERGTLSSLCGAKQLVVVGGYLTDETGAAMYEESGVADPAIAGGPAQPDLCAPAQIPNVRPIGFLSDELYDIRPPGSVEGTSIAAPLTTRALASLLCCHGAQSKEPLLAKLEAAAPSCPVAPTDDPAWTSAYWMPLPN